MSRSETLNSITINIEPKAEEYLELRHNKMHNNSLQLTSQYAAPFHSALYCPSAEFEH